jgi:hypothetical protein
MKVGDRIMLIEMPEDPCPIDPGSRGTIESIATFDHWFQVQVKWDNGRTLSLCVPPDRVVVSNG